MEVDLLSSRSFLKAEKQSNADKFKVKIFIFCVLVRPERAVLRAQDLEGEWFEREAEGYAARCFLHETDHCDGKLFIDHLPKMRREMVLKKFKKFR